MSDENNILITEATLMAYMNGELTDEQISKVKHWLAESDANKAEMERIEKIWLAAKQVKPVPVVVDVEKALANVLTQIRKNDRSPARAPRFNYRRIVVSAAAVIILLVGAVGLLNSIGFNSPRQLELKAENNVLEDQLADGTRVSLNQNSMLSYPSEFSTNQRRVKLVGEAFFEVERNEKKPFIIDLHHDFYVKVLGTSFNINANEGDSLTEVYVKTGKVEFGSTSDKIILMAGEIGVMNNRTGNVTKIVDKNESVKSLYWKTEALNFDHTTLAEALQTIADIFEVEIELNCEAKRSAQVVSKHQHESLEEILAVISSMHDLTLITTRKKYILTCD